MAARRRVALWTLASVGVAVAVAVSWALFTHVLLPRARGRKVEGLLRGYQASPDAETARLLAHLVDTEALPVGKAQEVLHAILTPSRVKRGRREGGEWDPIVVEFPHEGIDFARLELACQAYVTATRQEAAGTWDYGVPRVLRLEVSAPEEKGPFSPLGPGEHSTKLRLCFSFFRTEPTAGQRAAWLAKDTIEDVLSGTPRELRPGRLVLGLYEVHLDVPFEFDVVEPCDGDRGE